MPDGVDVSSNSGCTEPRHIVQRPSRSYIRFLSLSAPPKIADPIVVDYHKSVEQLFFDLLEYIRLEHGTVDFTFAKALHDVLCPNFLRRETSREQDAILESLGSFPIKAKKIGTITRLRTPISSAPTLPRTSPFCYFCFEVSGDHQNQLPVHRGIGNKVYQFDMVDRGLVFETLETSNAGPEEITVTFKTSNATISRFEDGKILSETLPSSGHPLLTYHISRRELLQILSEMPNKAHNSADSAKGIDISASTTIKKGGPEIRVKARVDVLSADTALLSCPDIYAFTNHKYSKEQPDSKREEEPEIDLCGRMHREGFIYTTITNHHAPGSLHHDQMEKYLKVREQRERIGSLDRCSDSMRKPRACSNEVKTNQPRKSRSSSPTYVMRRVPSLFVDTSNLTQTWLFDTPDRSKGYVVKSRYEDTLRIGPNEVIPRIENIE
ncbi:hypothetical protein G7Y89_g5984 [Cudoniella acicularis]|uniref:Uncharacterized protein n=1 Tax=Cudoniella acicularis TaxID=354080 RepID=A0A8H4RNS2_9HELO|nr:hypothetical protein G7Y89_g5984 [Cudoniella acicularis]